MDIIYIANSYSNTCEENHGIIPGIFQIDRSEWKMLGKLFEKNSKSCKKWSEEHTNGGHICGYTFDILKIYKECQILNLSIKDYILQ